MRKLITTIALLVILTSSAIKAQILKPVKWSFAVKKLERNEDMIILKAEIGEGWRIYSINQKDGGPVKTSFSFTPAGDAYRLIGNAIEPKPMTEHEDAFNMDVFYFAKSVIFQQKVKIKQDNLTVKGKLNFMVCNNHQCLPPEDVNFSIPIK
ncbi:MAG TPA: protein-disulfide reductase DsbD domain-containing protein [Mucilaginibacter sp.]|jgi:hypothetical protein|nr:protein-disulfide reductase DsbD domain-containing protein [Mucilaginibacter sp.]